MAGHKNWPLVINLGNSIIGVSTLAMPFCFKQCGILLGMITLLFCCWLTLASSSLLMKAGVLSRRWSYEVLAYHCHGAAGKFISEVGMIGMQLGTLIAQTVVVGDLGPAIISKFLGIENSNNLRTWLIILLCLGIGLPMGLLKDLRTVSRASTICIMFYCSFIIYIFLISIPNLWSGDWYFKVNLWRPKGLFQCLPILSFSFGCQTQLFLVYEELPEPSLKAISGVVSSAVNLCAVAYLLVGFFGYITFHALEVPGDILAVFPSTFIADLMKLCFVFSIVITFPVIIFPCRASIYTLFFAKKTKSYDDSLEGKSYMPENTFKLITGLIILTSMITAILIPNVEFILGMNGAIVGTLMCYIFPALFFIKVAAIKTEGKTLAQFVLIVGVTIALVSTFATLSSQDKGHTHLEKELPNVNPNVLDIGGIVKQVPAWQDKQPMEQNLQPPKDNLKDDLVVKKKDLGDDNRKEPPIPDSAYSNDKVQPVKNALQTKEKEDEKIKETELQVKEKELAAENQEKEKEKKQEQILEKLEQHRQDQEKLLKEQKAVLKELKDHKQKDQSQEEVPEKQAIGKTKDVKDEIVKQQQALLNQQQQVNLQQQELIKQQQQQINQQIMKDQLEKVTVKPPELLNKQQMLNAPRQELNQGLNPQQQAGNPQQVLDQGLNPPHQAPKEAVNVVDLKQGLNQPETLDTNIQGIHQGLNEQNVQNMNQQKIQ